MTAIFRFSQLVSRSSGLRQAEWRRNIGMTAFLLNNASKSSDPIQKLFSEKLKEYKKKSSAAGGGLFDTTPEMKAKFDAEMQQIRKRFGEGNLEEFPKFDFGAK